MTVIWTRLSTSSLSSSRETWPLTVATERCSVAAISALPWPRPTASATSRSRGLSVARRSRACSVAHAGVGVAGDQRDQPAGDRGRQHPVAGVDELDRADDLRRRGVLEQEAGRAGLQRAQDELVGVERREDEDGGRVGLRGEQPRRRDPVELRHADVHEDDVGPVEVDRAEHLAAVGGLAHDLEALRAGEHHPQARAHERVVVDEQDADHRGSAARAGRTRPRGRRRTRARRRRA